MEQLEQRVGEVHCPIAVGIGASLAAERRRAPQEQVAEDAQYIAEVLEAIAVEVAADEVKSVSGR